jgi:ubiquinone/menaquinone biosynthesis C-methylase UbiE
MNYKFLDVGCKIGGSFDISKKFGFTKEQGLGIDINLNHVEDFKNKGYNGMLADATNLPFEDNSFELVIFSHVIEHLPNEELGRKAFNECLRVSSKFFYLALPFFDEDEYLKSLSLKTFYSHWVGHTNMITLEKIKKEYLNGLKYDLTMIKKITDSSFGEIIPISSPIDSFDYDSNKHGEKKHIKFTKDIWREYSILIYK